ncbi:MAG: hypothetical protein P1V97_15920 [Planctomycetota bacterium]|nr:hypothetical protein [Planctomycetota bacterium]
MSENNDEKPPQNDAPDPDARSEDEKGYSDNPEGPGLNMSMWVILGMGLACSLCSAIAFAVFMLRSTTQVVKGRPFWRSGKARAPEAVVSQGESASQCSQLEMRTMEALGQAWLEDGEAEHASIAAFADLQLRLLALGAPRALLSETASAIQDEIRHGEFCYRQASTYTDKRYQPGAIRISGSRSGGLGPRSLRLGFVALESLFDGCLNEGIAAKIAKQASQRCKPGLSGALAKIAADEAAHGELAWKIVEWAASEGGALTTALLKRGVKRLETMEPSNQAEPTKISMELWLLEGQARQNDLVSAFYVQRRELLERMTDLLQPRRITASAA